MSSDEDSEAQLEIQPLFHYQGAMDLDLNEDHFEMDTDHEPAPNVVVASQAMAAHSVSRPRFLRPVEARGYNTPRWAKNGIAEKMTFNKNGQPVKPAATVARFSRFLGMLATEPSMFPINTTDWRNFHKGGHVDNAWIRIRVKFHNLLQCFCNCKQCMLFCDM